MNPVEVEKGVAAYLRSVQAMPAGLQIHESVTAEDLDFEKQACVVEMSDAEHRGVGAFLANVQVSLRTPAMAGTQSDHMATFDALVTALEDKADFATAFDAEADGIEYAGSFITSIPGPQFQDRAWVNSITMALGIATV